MELIYDDLAPQSASPQPTVASPTRSSGSEPSRPPTTHENESRPADHDSMVTVRLSEPPSLTVDTNVGTSSIAPAKTVFGHEYRPSDAMAETVQEEEGAFEDASQDSAEVTPRSNLRDELQESGDASPGSKTPPESDAEDVDWDQLQKTEEQQSKDQELDNTEMLLARLEQENAKLTTNPKTIKAQVVETQQSPTRRPRPPSMAQLKDMVHAPTPSALRYSMLPPPPMTDLEFYAALVKDYQQTAARLPTLLSNKIRKGIPPPLRGVVWQSMSSARDSVLEEQFERFSGESSPYEGIIGKDLGRSFPGVDMFRDPEGDGQRMLGRVLKCYSLHEPKIGYCQGLAFLVGPLLMHMPDKQAFCVLVKLMENYDLRTSYTPDLSGLHVRIYQFRELLAQHLPILSSHLDDLQVDPAYVSQWFLSFFAVTSPLPMLFRIFDVIFAEGASETIMRVALSLMQKNQGRLLACTEMEDVMQLLLSRGLWDCYHYNADEFVDDFTNLSHVVSRERLAALEQGYREAQIANNTSPNAVITTAASRFLGRLWVSSGASITTSILSPKSSTPTPTTLSPGLGAPLRPLSSMLRRSASKQSLASTLNSMEASSSSSSVLSSASTEATTLSRDSGASDDPSARDFAPGFAGPGSKLSNAASGNQNSDSRYLNSQIEDLLTALSDLQRQHALLSDQLQREREDRAEDRKAVRSLLDGLRQKQGAGLRETVQRGSSEETIKGVKLIGPNKALEESPLFRKRIPSSEASKKQNNNPTTDQLSNLLDTVEKRFGPAADNRRSSIPQTKLQLRDELARTKEQLANELAKGQDCSRRVYEMEQETVIVKDQLRETHAHVRTLHQDKQRLEKQMHGMRTRGSAETAPATVGAAVGIAAGMASDWFGRTNSSTTNSGLRELKLGRSKSTPSQATNGSSPFNKRASSFFVRGGRDSLVPGGMPPPANEQEALLLELVQAKTGEAVALQEAEEAKQKLESLRKALGMAPGDIPTASHNSTMASTAASAAAAQASAAASAAMGMLGRFTTSAAEANNGNKSTALAAATAASPASAPPTTTTTTTSGSGGYGGFFGWRRQ